VVAVNSEFLFLYINDCAFFVRDIIARRNEKQIKKIRKLAYKLLLKNENCRTNTSWNAIDAKKTSKSVEKAKKRFNRSK